MWLMPCFPLAGQELQELLQGSALIRPGVQGAPGSSAASTGTGPDAAQQQQQYHNAALAYCADALLSAPTELVKPTGATPGTTQRGSSQGPELSGEQWVEEPPAACLYAVLLWQGVNSCGDRALADVSPAVTSQLAGVAVLRACGLGSAQVLLMAAAPSDAAASTEPGLHQATGGQGQAQAGRAPSAVLVRRLLAAVQSLAERCGVERLIAPAVGVAVVESEQCAQGDAACKDVTMEKPAGQAAQPKDVDGADVSAVVTAAAAPKASAVADLDPAMRPNPSQPGSDSKVGHWC